MAESRTVESLTVKRDEIVRTIEAYETKLSQARADLTHINAAITMFSHDPEQMLDYKPYTSTDKLFRYGEFSKLCKQALEGGVELTGSEVAARVMEMKGMDRQDLVLLKTLTLHTAHTLNSMMHRKFVRCVGWQKLAKRKPVRIWALPEALSIKGINPHSLK